LSRRLSRARRRASGFRSRTVFEPLSSGKHDVICFTIVTIGNQVSLETQKLFDAGNFTRYLYLHGRSVETVEALAEHAHKQAWQLLGIAGADSPKVTDLFHKKYRGSR
jgi:5-methyltetrahydrofolate--homocysteine methyltransferase